MNENLFERVLIQLEPELAQEFVNAESRDFEKLLAFQVIKEKLVNVFILKHSPNLETYNDMVEDDRKLIQEEYDILKKVLL